ncbi:unnamed protein product [Caenorhabditis auriculariae]|uniref:EGF-like domain-containing protein n=1 Tax=Caenorhabditis auriculariae TaxID=2777116 RepID=A0A8S1HGX0_9PELO|nr:unnamed protein product [Caenorhabditis auriculariae]
MDLRICLLLLATLLSGSLNVDATTAATSATSPTSEASSSSKQTKATVTPGSSTSPGTTVSPGTTTTVEPIAFTTFPMKNAQTPPNAKIVLQQAVLLNQQILALTNELNSVTSDFNITNSPLLQNLTQLQSQVDTQNRTLQSYLKTLQKLNDVQDQQEANVTNIYSYFSCFAASSCVTASPTPSTARPTIVPGTCPGDPAKAVSDSKSFQVPSKRYDSCANNIQGDDNTKIFLNVSVTIQGDATLEIVGRTGNTSTFTNTSTASSLSFTSPVKLNYRTSPSSQIGFTVDYRQSSPCDSLDCTTADPKAKCIVSPSGQARCQCSSPCVTGDLCTETTNPCTTRAKKACGQTAGNGYCATDSCDPTTCAFRCVCADGTEGLSCSDSGQTITPPPNPTVECATTTPIPTTKKASTGTPGGAGTTPAGGSTSTKDSTGTGTSSNSQTTTVTATTAQGS